MWNERAGLLALASLLWALVPDAASAAARNLDGWLGDELGPALVQTLTRHPRFRGAPVRVQVVGADGDPAARPDALTASVARRLAGLLGSGEGVILVESFAGNAPAVADPQSCLPSPEHYWLTLEAMPVPAGLAGFRVRALDLRDSAWVPGLSYQWQGRLTAAERALQARVTETESLRGSRELPFVEDQGDLAGARLAARLACQLRAHPARAPATRLSPETGEVGAMTARYLAGAGLIRLAGDPGRSLVMTTSRVPVSAELEQLWIALSPESPDPELPEVRAMVYVRAAGQAAAASGPAALPGPDRVAPPSSPAYRAPSAAASPPAPARLAPLSLLFLPAGCEARRCDGPARTLHPAAPLPGAGLAVAVEGTPGAVVYLYGILGSRLAGLGPGHCGAGSHRIGADGLLRVPLSAHPALTGVLAVAAPSAGSAGTLEGPGRACPGLAGDSLERWLKAVSAAGLGQPGSGDWQVLAITSAASRVTLARGGGP